MISSYQLYHYSQRCQLNLTARQFMNYYLLYIYIYYVFIIRWGTHIYVSLFPYAHPSVCLSIHRIPYRRNHTSSNHNFWYIHVCKMIISLSFCFFFHFFEIYICHTPYLRNSGIWSWVLVHLCKMMISPDVFLIFLKFSFFGLLGG